jgi:hypothetical protein
MWFILLHLYISIVFSPEHIPLSRPCQFAIDRLSSQSTACSADIAVKQTRGEQILQNMGAMSEFQALAGWHEAHSRILGATVRGLVAKATCDFEVRDAGFEEWFAYWVALTRGTDADRNTVTAALSKELATWLVSAVCLCGLKIPIAVACQFTGAGRYGCACRLLFHVGGYLNTPSVSLIMNLDFPFSHHGISV